MFSWISNKFLIARHFMTKDNYGDVDGKLEVIARDGYFIFDFEHHNNFASKTCLKKSHHSYRKLEVIAGKRYCIFSSWYQCFFCS